MRSNAALGTPNDALGNRFKRGEDEMVGKMVSGGIATNNQRQRDLLPIVTRFFKVMYGKGCSEVLYLPPKFARNVRELAGKNAQIEDSNGQKWTARCSYVDGALAFQEGWHQFFADHGLEYGQILVFNYVKKGHFIVQIYGFNACEVIDYDREKNRQKKRLRRDQEKTVPRDALYHIMDVNSMEKPSSTPSVSSGQEFHNSQSHPMETNASNSASDLGKLQLLPTMTNMEDPSCMLNRYSGYYQEEDRTFLFDLSSFEMGKNSSDVCKCETSMERTIIPVETQIREQTEVKENDTQMAVMPSNQNDYDSYGIFGDMFHSKFSNASDLSKDRLDEVCKYRNDAESPSIVCSQCAECKYALKSYCCDSSVSGKLAAAIKKEVVESKEEDYDFPRASCGAEKASMVTTTYGQMSFPNVKIEPKMPDDFALAVGGCPFSAEVKSQSFLELPSRIPSIPGKRERGQRKVVYLRDSTEGLWPVLYSETFLFKAFTGGWRIFCKGNSISVGDWCTFQVEDHILCIYRVNVIHKDGQSSHE